MSPIITDTISVITVGVLIIGVITILLQGTAYN